MVMRHVPWVNPEKESVYLGIVQHIPGWHAQQPCTLLGGRQNVAEMEVTLTKDKTMSGFTMMDEAPKHATTVANSYCSIHLICQVLASNIHSTHAYHGLVCRTRVLPKPLPIRV